MDISSRTTQISGDKPGVWTKLQALPIDIWTRQSATATKMWQAAVYIGGKPSGIESAELPSHQAAIDEAVQKFRDRL